MSIAFFLLVVVGYGLLIGVGCRLFATPRNAAPPLPRRQALGWLYRLTTTLACLPILAYGVPRVSVSNALLPAVALLAVGSGVVAGVYAASGRRRRLLLAHAAVGGLLAPVVAYGLWVVGLGKPAYHQYPFTVQVRSAEYEAANWTWKGYAEPKNYTTLGLYKTGWGFDYYVGDIQLDYPLQAVGAGPFSPAAAAADRAFWRSVRGLTVAPDECQGHLRVQLPFPPGGDNAFTEQRHPVAEQMLPFWVTRSTAQPPRL